jgi:uncharacterized membrane protein YphA (DoxX/SURF4 family)
MSRTTDPDVVTTGPADQRVKEERASHQAFLILRVAFTAAPILFGLDKFFNVMADWGHYLAPALADLSPFDVATTMYVVGAVEVVAGILVGLSPRLGAPVVAAWLAGIIVNLVVLGGHLDIALRDFGLVLAALALFALSRIHDARPLGRPRGRG